MKVFPVFLPHAGCPHRCVFCSQVSVSGQSSPFEPKDLDRWLADVLPDGSDGEVAFYGSTFTALPEAVQADYLAVVQPYIDVGRIGGVRVSTRPDALDKRGLEFLLTHRVRTIEIGCQSFSPEVLILSGRGHTVPESCAAIRLCLQAGVRTGLQLMPGLPGADRQEALQSAMTALALKPSFLRVYPTVVVRGTRLESLWTTGAYQPWSLEQAIDVCADIKRLSDDAGIPVVRFGLQQTPGLGESIVAGPHHPAFGQMVKSRQWRRALADMMATGIHRFTVNPVDLSDVIGHRRENVIWFQQNHDRFQLDTALQVPVGHLLYARDGYGATLLNI